MKFLDNPFNRKIFFISLLVGWTIFSILWRYGGQDPLVSIFGGLLFTYLSYQRIGDFFRPRKKDPLNAPEIKKKQNADIQIHQRTILGTCIVLVIVFTYLQFTGTGSAVIKFVLFPMAIAMFIYWIKVKMYYKMHEY